MLFRTRSYVCITNLPVHNRSVSQITFILNSNVRALHLKPVAITHNVKLLFIIVYYIPIIMDSSALQGMRLVINDYEHNNT
jgi:hypothetical protein